MSTAEMIYDRARTLPEDLQKEALHYLEYLRQLRRAETEDRDWAALSAAQLSRHYAPADAIYDQD